MNKVLIRVDGGKNIGMGHIMRMLTLSEELKKHFDIIFICRYDNTNKYLPGIEKIKESRFKVHIIDSSNIVDQIINIQKFEEADLFITDSYDVNEEYFDSLKKYFYKTVYIDDVNICRMNVDFVINPNISAQTYKYNTEPNENAKLLLGAQYTILRNEFMGFNRKTINENVENVMITVGGMDDKYLTLRIIKLLSNFKLNLHVIIGDAFDDLLKSKIKGIKANNLKIILYENATMSKVMEKCDLAISACGSTLYELIAMKVPTIGLVVADNQKEVAKILGDYRIIINTEKLIYTNEDKFLIKFIELLDNYDLRKELIENGKNFIDLNGAKKICKEIINLL